MGITFWGVHATTSVFFWPFWSVSLVILRYNKATCEYTYCNVKLFCGNLSMMSKSTASNIDLQLHRGVHGHHPGAVAASDHAPCSPSESDVFTAGGGGGTYLAPHEKGLK